MVVSDEPRPWVTLHFAQSLDGRIATRTGASKWISGPEATRFSHQLRAESDAIVIGSETALVDDPRLTVRHVEGASPIRVVLDARERVPDHCRLCTDPSARTILVGARERAVHAAHVSSWAMPTDPRGRLRIDAVLRRLYAEGARTVLVEGGQAVLTSLLRDGLADRIIVAIAPLFIGSGVDAVAELGIDTLDRAPRYRLERTWRLGDDVLLELHRGA